MLGANLFFKIELLLFELILERFDLVVRKRILDRNRNLFRDLLEELGIFS